MAGSSFFMLIDDIATLLDDIAVMSKVAAKKTAGVLGDDLALNAQQVTGIKADRELPVVWAVAKGSLVNKVILVPAALAISLLLPWLITPLLMIGGAFLCFEGVEKLVHSLFHKKEKADHHAEVVQAVANPEVDMVAFEKDKIKGAVRTDFILSAEIVVISLGTMAAASITQQALALTVIALAMTVGVYGLVAGIVKLDDAGLYLHNLQGEGKALLRGLGRLLLSAAPKLMKTLSVVGTAAMFLVGGGILVHGAPGGHDFLHAAAHALEAIPAVGAVLAWFSEPVVNGVAGVIAGILVLLVVNAVGVMWKKLRAA